jgi:hypothetical protein
MNVHLCPGEGKESPRQAVIPAVFFEIRATSLQPGSSKAIGEEAGDLLKELTAALLELVRDPALCSSSDFTSRLIILEQHIQRHITSGHITFV